MASYIVVLQKNIPFYAEVYVEDALDTSDAENQAIEEANFGDASWIEEDFEDIEIVSVTLDAEEEEEWSEELEEELDEFDEEDEF